MSCVTKWTFHISQAESCRKFIESSTRCVEPDHVIDVGFSVLDGIIIAVMTPPGPAPRITKGEYSAKIFAKNGPKTAGKMRNLKNFYFLLRKPIFPDHSGLPWHICPCRHHSSLSLSLSPGLSPAPGGELLLLLLGSNGVFVFVLWLS